MGLLGSSVSLAILRAFGGVKTVGYSHRSETRREGKDETGGIDKTED